MLYKILFLSNQLENMVKKSFDKKRGWKIMAKLQLIYSGKNVFNYMGLFFLLTH